jgi:hypothetical protein
MQVTVGKSLFKQVDLLGQKLESAVMEKASDIVTDAVGLSPVHTGAFVESWQINPRGERSRRARSSAGRTPLPEGAKEAKRETEKSRLLSRVASFDFSTLDGFTLTNTAPHNEFIEENPRLRTGLKPSEIQAYLRDKHG